MSTYNYNPFISQIDQTGISPYKIDTFSCKKIVGRKRKISTGQYTVDLTPSPQC